MGVITILPPGHGVLPRGHSVGVRHLLLALADDGAGHRGGGQILLLGGVQGGVLVVPLGVRIIVPLVLSGGLAGIREGDISRLG